MKLLPYKPLWLDLLQFEHFLIGSSATVTWIYVYTCLGRICAVNQDKTEADAEEQTFTMSGLTLLSNCLHPVLNFPQRTHEKGILVQIVIEHLYQGYI